MTLQAMKQEIAKFEKEKDVARVLTSKLRCMSFPPVHIQCFPEVPETGGALGEEPKSDPERVEATPQKDVKDVKGGLVAPPSVVSETTTIPASSPTSGASREEALCVPSSIESDARNAPALVYMEIRRRGLFLLMATSQ